MLPKMIYQLKYDMQNIMKQFERQKNQPLIIQEICKEINFIKIEIRELKILSIKLQIVRDILDILAQCKALYCTVLYKPNIHQYIDYSVSLSLSLFLTWYQRNC